MLQQSLLPAEPVVTRRGTLRDYQNTAITSAVDGLNRSRTGLVVSPTGTGKGVMIAETCRRFDHGGILVLAEARPILRQLQKTIRSWCGEAVGLEQAENYAAGERIVCASRQTLAPNDLRLEKLRRNPPRVIIVDEAHHAGHRGSAKNPGQYRRILEALPDALVLGFTATPDRGDRQALEQTFGEVFFKYEIHEAVEDGWLVPVRTQTINNWEALDLSRVRRVAGELCESEIEELLAKVVKEQAREGLKKIDGMKSIWFCGRVATAHQLAEAIRGLTGSDCARDINGEMEDDEKDEILDGFKAGHFTHLVNVGIATEGFDCPDAVAAVLTRPYLARGRFTQACGRVLRPQVEGGLEQYATAAERRAAIAASAKPWAMLVNYRYIAGKHTLVCPEDVLGGKYSDEEKALAADLREQDDAKTVTESLKQAREQLDETRQRKEADRARQAELVRRAKAEVEAQWGTFNPFAALGMEMPDVEVAGDRPPERASEAMKAWLRSQNIKVPDNCTKAQAMKLRRTLEARTKAGLATVGQVRWLKDHGVQGAESWYYARAADVMAEMQRRGR